jgi:hypothetical protein
MQIESSSAFPKPCRKIRNDLANHLVKPLFHALFSSFSLRHSFIRRRKRFQSFERKRIFFYCIGPLCRPTSTNFPRLKGHLSWSPNHIAQMAPSSPRNWPCVRSLGRPAHRHPQTGRPLLGLLWPFAFDPTPSEKTPPCFGAPFPRRAAQKGICWPDVDSIDAVECSEGSALKESPSRGARG